MSNYQIRSLQHADLRQMHRSFLEAFSDYPVPMQPTYPQFESRMLHKLHINFQYSVGAFSSEKLAGFLFNTGNTFENVPTIYNGGTGVIPGHRRQGLTSRMFSFLLEQPIGGYQRILLETLTTNEVAMRAYEQIGFKRTRFFLCFKLGGRTQIVSKKDYLIKEGTLNMSDTYASFDSVEGCFSDSFQQLGFNRNHERVLECHVEDRLAGYLIIQPEHGRVSRLAVAKDCRRQGVATHLLKSAWEDCGRRPLYFINVPEEAVDVRQFLINLGFENQVDQWEMELRF